MKTYLKDIAKISTWLLIRGIIRKWRHAYIVIFFDPHTLVTLLFTVGALGWDVIYEGPLKAVFHH